MAFRRSPQQDPGLPFTRSLRAPTYSQFGSTSCRRCYPGRGVRALLFVWFSSKFVILCAMGMLCSLTEVSAQFSFFWASAVLVSEAPLPALVQLCAGSSTTVVLGREMPHPGPPLEARLKAVAFSLSAPCR